MKYIRTLAVDGLKLQDVHSAKYTYGDLKRVEAPVARPLQIYSLDALAGYAKNECDPADHFLHVINPQHVEIVGRLNQDRNRETVAHAISPDDSALRNFVDQMQSHERFTVGAQCLFMPGEALDALLEFTSCIVVGEEAEISDDGTHQTVKIRRGATPKKARVQNPVLLTPRRSFPEVYGQLEPSPFILRIATDGRVGLFEADGGAWRIQASAMVAKYLDAYATGLKVYA